LISLIAGEEEGTAQAGDTAPQRGAAYLLALEGFGAALLETACVEFLDVAGDAAPDVPANALQLVKPPATVP
jgi:hypothetical protein